VIAFAAGHFPPRPCGVMKRSKADVSAPTDFPPFGTGFSSPSIAASILYASTDPVACPRIALGS